MRTGFEGLERHEQIFMDVSAASRGLLGKVTSMGSVQQNTAVGKASCAVAEHARDLSNTYFREESEHAVVVIYGPLVELG